MTSCYFTFTIQPTALLPVTTQSGLLMTVRKKPTQNKAGKGENADEQHFSSLTVKFAGL